MAYGLTAPPVANLDLSILPNLSTLAIFVASFRRLVRRAGSHTNIWFIGWTFLLLHYAGMLFAGNSGSLEPLRLLFTIWTLEMCGFCFILAASNKPVERNCLILLSEIAMPVMLQSALLTFHVESHALRVVNLLLLLSFGIHQLLFPRHRTVPYIRLAVIYAIVALALVPFPGLDPYLVTSILLCLLFLTAAYLSYYYAPRMTRGMTLSIMGLVVWALTYPLSNAIGTVLPDGYVTNVLLNLPPFLVMAGVVVSLLEEHVGRTEQLALHDPLTGLPNRRLFEIRLDQALEESQHTRTPLACLVIDVDNFKRINDTMGHAAGDVLLRALATRLSWNLGPRDMLARTGGDEFTAILVEAADEYHVRFVGGAMIAAGCVPVSINDESIDVRISIGIAVSPKDGTDPVELHKAADEAMYRAKRRGGSVFVFSGEELPAIHAVKL